VFAPLREIKFLAGGAKAQRKLFNFSRETTFNLLVNDLIFSRARGMETHVEKVYRQSLGE
jgi:hypothetical protein